MTVDEHRSCPAGYLERALLKDLYLPYEDWFAKLLKNTTVALHGVALPRPFLDRQESSKDRLLAIEVELVGAG